MCRNYWRDYDTALFILKHLYRGIHKDNLPEKSGMVNSKKESSYARWSGHGQTVDEELPLTFSERSMIRYFSRKAKKLLKKVLSYNMACFFFVFAG